MKIEVLSDDDYSLAINNFMRDNSIHSIGDLTETQMIEIAKQEALRDALGQVVEWGEVVCYEHKPSMKKRRRCDVCWQELKRMGE